MQESKNSQREPRFSRIPRIVVAIAVLVVAASGVAFGDTIDLRAGIHVDGKVVRATEGENSHVIIEVDPELRIAIKRTRIAKTTLDQDEALVWYREQLKVVPDSADAHYQLARQCKAKGLRSQCKYHFDRAITYDPNHSKARSALGYVRDGNEWVRYEEKQRRDGMIQTADGWQVPEVYARSQLREQADDAAKIWVKDFAKLRSLYLRGGKRADEALASIEQIEDPLASMAIAEALEESSGKSTDPKSLRLMYVRKLAAFRTPVAVKALVKVGLLEPDATIRSEALHLLKDYGAGSAVATYLPMLKNEKLKPAQVTSALQALNEFPDPELWREYVDALVTEHKTVIKAGSGMNVGRNSLGGMGMAMGGKDEVKTDYSKNAGALSLLKKIAPDVDFRYDQAAWRQYFADQLNGGYSDLRRDP